MDPRRTADASPPIRPGRPAGLPARLAACLPPCLLALGAALPAPAAPPPPATPDTLGRYAVTTEVVHEIPSGWTLQYVYPSPDRRRVVVSVTRGGRKGHVHIEDNGRKRELDKGGYFWIEGQGPGPEWDALLWGGWSPDSRRFAYVALKGEQAHVVVDGAEIGAYDYVANWKVRFSPDGSHHGFVVARLGKKGPESWQAVVDGVASERFDMIRGPEGGPLLRFSPTGGHWACFVRRGDDNLALVDGRFGPPFDETAYAPAFSPDGEHLAYVGVRGDDWYLALDDTLIGPHAWICDPVFSPVSDDLAYCVNEEDRGWVVRDGRPLRRHRVVRGPVFSPDGSRLAYWAAEQEPGSHVVVDSTAGPLAISAASPRFQDDGLLFYDVYLNEDGSRRAFYLEDRRLPDMEGTFASIPYEQGTGSLSGLWLDASPDGSHYVYSWRIDEAESGVVVDGRRWRRMDDLFFAGPVAWSPDGRHHAFRAAGKDECIVVDGEPGPLYDSAMGVSFSPDGTEVAYVASRKEHEEMLVIGGHEGRTWREIVPSTVRFQEDGSVIHYAGEEKGRQVYRVVLRPLRATASGPEPR